jgi:2-phospho-L-lactate guanylyltransferase
MTLRRLCSNEGDGMSRRPSGGLWALVPIKPFHMAKERLRQALSDDDREALSRGMVLRTLSVLTRTPELSGVAVVTGDERATALAKRSGVTVFADPENGDLNAAVALGAQRLFAGGATAVLILPSDLPLILPADVAALLRRSAHDVVIVRAGDGGTNGLLTSVMEPRLFTFGADSASRHLDRATAFGLSAEVRCNPAFLDIDTPSDLEELSKVEPERLAELLACGRRDLAARRMIAGAAA